MLDELPKTRAAMDPVLVKLEILVSDVVIRTEVEVEHLAGVILAMRASLQRDNQDGSGASIWMRRGRRACNAGRA
jgi:hypothetical protein